MAKKEAQPTGRPFSKEIYKGWELRIYPPLPEKDGYMCMVVKKDLILAVFIRSSKEEVIAIASNYIDRYGSALEITNDAGK